MTHFKIKTGLPNEAESKFERSDCLATEYTPAWARLRKKQHGMTLMELLVAVTIYSILIVVLGSVAQGVGSTWVSTQKRTNRQQSARAIISFISRDLQGALAPIVANNTQSLQLIRNPSTVDASLRSGHTLFWQAPYTGSNDNEGIATLGYFIRWSATPQGTQKATLCRLHVPPGHAENRIHTDPNNWVNSDVLAALAPATSASHYMGLMSENIVGFWAEPIDKLGNVITQPQADYDSRIGYNINGATYPPGSLPAAFRVSIATIDARSAARLTTSLQSLANSHPNAEAFVAAIRSTPAHQAIAEGVQAHTVSIVLANAR